MSLPTKTVALTFVVSFLPLARPVGQPPSARAARGRPATFEDAGGRLAVGHRHRGARPAPLLRPGGPWLASWGAAVAAADVDSDGDTDLYATTSRQGYPNALYLNEKPGGRFREAAAEAGVGAVNDEDGVSTGALFADLDADGDPDLYVVQWGRNRLFRNEGGGRFTDITQSAGVGDRGNASRAIAFDADGDGDLDLYVCNYFPPVDIRRVEDGRVMPADLEEARDGGANRFYRNEGNLRFTEAARPRGIADTGWSLDAAASDIDRDGDLDLYVANNLGPDRLFRNEGDGTFRDITEHAIGIDRRWSTSVDFADIDGDGFPDAYICGVTASGCFERGSRLLLNNGDGTFVDLAHTAGTADGGWACCARFFDYDLDGDLDIISVGGGISAGRASYWSLFIRTATDPAIDIRDPAAWPAMGSRSLSGFEPARLFRNEGDGSFTECAPQEGISSKLDGRDTAIADLDGDGDLDVAVANQDGPLLVYRNRSAAGRRSPPAAGASLLSLEKKLSRSPLDAALGNLYRKTARELGRHERPIVFFSDVAGTYRGRNVPVMVRLQLALAFIDKIPSIEKDVLLRASLAKESLLRLERLLRGAPDCYSAQFIAGMNHLYWPAGLKHAPDALRFLESCRRRASVLGKAHELRLDIAIGDALVKNKDLAGARLRWRKALDEFGSDPALSTAPLEKRLALGDVALVQFVRAVRGLDRPIDTSLPFLAREKEPAVRETRKTPSSLDPRFRRILELVDRLCDRTLGPLAKGRISNEALALLRDAAGRSSDSWAVELLRGTIDLDWSLKPGRAPQAVLALERALRLAESATTTPCAEVYRALGDAMVKDHQFIKARNVWKKGLKLHPDDPGLAERLGLTSLMVNGYVNRERSWKTAADTAALERFLARTAASTRRTAPEAAPGSPGRPSRSPERS